MGWGGGTPIFDAVAKEILNLDALSVTEKKKILSKLLDSLDAADYDNHQDSIFADHMLVKALFKKRYGWTY